jgi:hypothetical protein
VGRDMATRQLGSPSSAGLLGVGMPGRARSPTRTAGRAAGQA